MLCVLFFFFKQKTAYEMRISDWSSDVCSSDLAVGFVEDQRLDLRKIDGALANMVKQAARRGDDNLGALRQLLDLRRDADAAKDQDGAHMRQMLAVGEIGRAACRERVCQYVLISGVAVSLKKQKEKKKKQ